jgi:hypothetical protein
MLPGARRTSLPISVDCLEFDFEFDTLSRRRPLRHDDAPSRDLASLFAVSSFYPSSKLGSFPGVTLQDVTVPFLAFKQGVKLFPFRLWSVPCDSPIASS